MWISSENTHFFLIGFEEYDDNEGLPPLPAACNNVFELRKALTRNCNFKNECITTVFEIETPVSLYKKLEQTLARDGIKNFFFFFSGHGMLDDKDNLCLCYKGTDTSKPLNFNNVIKINDLNDTFLERNNLNFIIVFDCCFSEKAFKGFTLRNQLIMAASSREAKYLEKDEFSVFSGKFIEIIKEGIVDGPEEITFKGIYKELLEKVNEQFPAPKIATSGSVEDLILRENKQNNLIVYSQEDKEIIDELYNIIISQNPLLHDTTVDSYSKRKEVILRQYPTPISTYLKNIIGTGNLTLEYLQEGYKTIKDFFFFLVVSEYLHIKNISKNTLERIDSIDEILLSIDGGVIKKVGNILNATKGNNDSFFITELKKWSLELEPVFLENEEALTSGSQEIIKKSLLKLITALSFLNNYFLISVRVIEVQFWKYSSKPKFLHEASLLKGEVIKSYNKKIQLINEEKQLTLDSSLNNNSVILTKHFDNQISGYLNLWPLVIDKNVYALKGSADLPDIQVLNKKVNNNYLYKSLTYKQNNKYCSFRDMDKLSSNEDIMHHFRCFENDIYERA